MNAPLPLFKTWVPTFPNKSAVHARFFLEDARINRRLLDQTRRRNSKDSTTVPLCVSLNISSPCSLENLGKVVVYTSLFFPYLALVQVKAAVTAMTYLDIIYVINWFVSV